MTSGIIKGQMTIDFEPGLTERYRSLRDCVATGVYKRGLTNVAAMIDEASSNLSVQLSDGEVRKFSVDSFERYLEKSKDLTPVYYLIEKFLADKTVSRDAALAQLAPMVVQLVPLLKQAGLI